MNSAARIRPEDFEFLQRVVREEAGLMLEPGKEYLAETRLGILARREGLESLQRLIQKIRGEPPTGALRRRAVEAMLTHETSFFRDPQVFEVIRRRVLPELITLRSAEKRLDVWCAAAASGQEPYSLAMVVREYQPVLSGWTVRMMATDLSEPVLARARRGEFSGLEMGRGLSRELRDRHFRVHGSTWRIRDELRDMVEFTRMNLAGPWTGLPRFDLVLMRNVLIYFEAAEKRAVLERLRQHLRPGGLLFLGSTETSFQIHGGFERVTLDGVSAYRLGPEAAAGPRG